MAFFNDRRLFGGTQSESNISQFCPPQCPLSCPPGCPPLFSPPPPPPLPPPFLDQSNQNQKISPLVIIIVSVLSSCFLVVSYYAIIVKYCSSWNNSRRRASQSQNTHQEFLDEDQSPVMDHPIWFITTVGLEQSIINSIAVCKYNKGDGLVEGTECSVCLNEFQENESLRLLPKCSHAFHIPCIDTWLRSHTNCPLCRAPIVSSNPVCSNSNEPVQNLNDSGLGEETQVENSENDGDLGSDGELQNGRRDIEIENEGVSSSSMNCEIRVLSDLGDNHRLVENGIQPVLVRRSVSLDFSMFCFSVAEENSTVQVAGEKKTNLETMPKNLSLSPIDFRLIGSSSKGRLLEKEPISLKRSLEKEPISLKRSFSSQCSRNHRSSILPL